MRVNRLTWQIHWRIRWSFHLAGLTYVTCAGAALCLCPFTLTLPTTQEHYRTHPQACQGTPKDVLKTILGGGRQGGWHYHQH
ncbi:hypothetical protein FB451DRAFT_1295532 [Mycena latifolia]|nr:hypothetical protein FB451DRAFT_1295532 [Mycena latifolia]